MYYLRQLKNTLNHEDKINYIIFVRILFHFAFVVMQKMRRFIQS